MLMHDWIMLSSLLLPYFFAIVLCPRNSWAGPVRTPLSTTNLRQPRRIALEGGVSYSLHDDQNIVDSRLVEFGYYRELRPKDYKRWMRRANRSFEKRLRQMANRIRRKSPNNNIYAHIFHQLDLNNDQSITRDELEKYLRFLAVDGRRRHRHERKRKRKRWRERKRRRLAGG